MEARHKRLVQMFDSLTDTEISCWSGVEMALTEGRVGGEVWDDMTVPFLQMLYVDARFVDGTCWRFATEHVGCLWGLSAIDSDKLGADASVMDGIYRSSILSCLPCGVVRGVEISTADCLIENVKIVFDTSSLRLSAGEVYEQHDGSFRIVPQDESVLIQVDDAHPRQNNAQHHKSDRAGESEA